MGRLDRLCDSLAATGGAAEIGSIAAPKQPRRRVDFSDPYYRPSARFVVRADAPVDAVTPEAVEGKKVAVVAGSAHAQYLRTLFTEADVRGYADAAAARGALRRGAVGFPFGDGFAVS